MNIYKFINLLATSHTLDRLVLCTAVELSGHQKAPEPTNWKFSNKQFRWFARCESKHGQWEIGQDVAQRARRGKQNNVNVDTMPNTKMNAMEFHFHSINWATEPHAKTANGQHTMTNISTTTSQPSTIDQMIFAQQNRIETKTKKKKEREKKTNCNNNIAPVNLLRCTAKYGLDETEPRNGNVLILKPKHFCMNCLLLIIIDIETRTTGSNNAV